MSNVYQRLQAARILLQKKELKKSGKNKFAGYEYFELQDFLPAVQEIFANTGLCAVFRCTDSEATLTLYATENPESFTVFTAPMAAAELKGCHPVQNLGASISYLRRYLYVNAMEIVEHDALDATTGSDAGKPAPKPVPKPITASGNPIAKAENLPTKDWQIKISGDSNSQDWLDLVAQAVDTTLNLATNQNDVMTIYKCNKQLFDDVKSKDEPFFKGLLEKFSKRKEELKAE